MRRSKDHAYSITSLASNCIELGTRTSAQRIGSGRHDNGNGGIWRFAAANHTISFQAGRKRNCVMPITE
jgi:hypothetical protein